MTKKIAILGSTGSIGTQALEVIAAHSGHFSVEVLTANNNADLLIEQALKFKPNCVVIANEQHYEYVKNTLWEHDIKTYAGNDAIADVVQMDSVDMVLTAMVGFSGLLPTIKAIEARKNIALANKETLVVAGEIITALAAQNKVALLPVDSEHSAIFQCLTGEWHNPLEKIYLTASGGPFFGKKAEELQNITKKQALKHPNWDMGAKITIDSATLMNKGLEVIEARWLFNLKPEQIDVIVHQQSIIHSIVQFTDGSMKAQMGLPDMKLPIQYALSFPHRLPSGFPRFNFLDFPTLTFAQPDKKTFRNLQLAYDAMEKGGNMPCALNAANEIAVEAFLHDKIKFLDIAAINEEVLRKITLVQKITLSDLLETDRQARQYATEIINRKYH